MKVNGCGYSLSAVRLLRRMKQFSKFKVSESLTKIHNKTNLSPARLEQMFLHKVTTETSDLRCLIRYCLHLISQCSLTSFKWIWHNFNPLQLKTETTRDIDDFCNIFQFFFLYKIFNLNLSTTFSQHSLFVPQNSFLHQTYDRNLQLCEFLNES